MKTPLWGGGRFGGLGGGARGLRVGKHPKRFGNFVPESAQWQQPRGHGQGHGIKEPEASSSRRSAQPRLLSITP